MNYGPDGAFWFDSPTTSSLGRITLAGVIASYPIPTPNSGPGAIITGLDGAIWFVETNTDKIGRLALTTTTPPSQLQITTFSPLPAGGVGTSYSQALTATGGTPPYTWTLTSGTLPTGLMLSTGGVVTGTPTTVATQTFTTQVTDANSSSATASFTLSINAVACTYTFTNMAENGPPGPFTIGPSAGGGSITVLTGASCPWSVSGAPSWVTSGSTPPVQLGGVTATGNGIVYFSILPNYGPNSRSGTLTIAGTTFPITQQAGLIPSSGFMPHLAAEGGWLTTFTLVNKGSFAADTQLSLTDDNGNPLAVPLAFPQQPSVSPVTEASLDQTIAPNASLIVQASGPANIPYVEGSAQMTSAGAVDGFAIFRYNPSGQEAVVPLGGSGTLIPFDNTNGVLTGIAIENPVSFQAITVPVILRDDTGTQIGTGMETVQLGANGHTSFVLSTQFPVTANIRGTIQFPQFEYCITVTGSCTGAVGFGFPTVLGIRYTPPGTLTTLAPLNFGPGLLPHIAAGNGWQTTFVLVNGPNVGTSYAQADLNFFDNNGNPLPVPLTVLETGASTTTASLSLSIPPNASRWIQTTASAASALLTGSAQLSAGVSGFAIYRYNPNGQEAVVPLETRNAATYLIPFDNTNGTNTGIALSLSAPVPFGGAAAPIGVPVLVRDDSGNQVAAATIPVAANGHISQVLTTLFPTTANIRGTVEFDTPPGAAISVLGIRSPPALTFTTLPALAR
jgi:hypothetical protein